MATDFDSRTLLVLVLSALMLPSLGCFVDKTIEANVVADAQAAYDEALVAIEAKDTDAALEQLNIALQPGSGLPGDIHVDARIQRAICLARNEQFEPAHADLDVAAEGAGDMSQVHAARSFVLSKEGKSKESKTEMSKAKKINRSVKAIR